MAYRGLPRGVGDCQVSHLAPLGSLAPFPARSTAAVKIILTHSNECNASQPLFKARRHRERAHSHIKTLHHFENEASRLAFLIVLLVISVAMGTVP